MSIGDTSFLFAQYRGSIIKFASEYANDDKAIIKKNASNLFWIGSLFPRLD